MAETQRVAIVTGAAGGIGRAMVRALLAAGIRVAGVDRDREPLDALAASAREQGKGSELLTIQTDLASDSAADEITKATRTRFGRIDILVNNAGIGPGSIRPDSWQRPLKFWEITPDQWRGFVAVHTTAPLALANAVLPEMMRQGWGRIVNVTTSLGTMINPGFPTYGPSKAALEALSAIMAKDLEGTGVTVNVLVPGGITNTPMVSESGFDRAKMIQPEVMAPPLVWLVSDAAGKVTGRRFLGVHWDADASARTSGREGWGTGGMDEHCYHANHAEPVIARAVHLSPRRPMQREISRACRSIAAAAVAGALIGPSLATAQQPHPAAVGDLMTALVQPRHIKLGLAGSEQNWPYAAYELDQLRETFADLAEILPKYRDLSIPELIRSTVTEPLEALDRSIQAKDGSQFTVAYGQLTGRATAATRVTIAR